MAKRIVDLTPAEREQVKRDGERPASQRYAADRLAGLPTYAHQATDDIADRLLDYTGPEAAALLDEVEARLWRGRGRR